jgi:catechol 2,3-dioxygenase-like lactoylglutathione lyase family enzyme
MECPHLQAVGFTCADADASAAFFVDSLGARVQGDLLEVNGGPYTALIGLQGARLRLRRLALGAEVLELTEVLEPGPGARPGRPIPADSRSNDHGFQHICLVVNSMEEALDGLRPALDAGRIRPISTTPQRLPDWNSAAAGIVAYKFHDPEGHPLELLEFPPDKGDARWHRAGPGPLLGIDHSAIGIADTARSVRFYAELLGLRHLSDGENSGAEQDGLDGLRDVRVRISSLRYRQGPGIECLEYRSPPGGRELPPDLGPQDVGHWQLRLWLDDLEIVAKGASAYGGRLISPGIVDLADQAPLVGAPRALQLADPDGHRLQLLQSPVQG